MATDVRWPLFGSRAKGNYRSGSDIDLVLDADNLSFDEIMKIDQQLDDLLLPYQIDLLIMNAIESKDLLEHIKRVGVVLYTQMNKQ